MRQLRLAGVVLAIVGALIWLWGWFAMEESFARIGKSVLALGCIPWIARWANGYGKQIKQKAAERERLLREEAEERRRMQAIAEEKTLRECFGDRPAKQIQEFQTFLLRQPIGPKLMEGAVHDGEDSIESLKDCFNAWLALTGDTDKAGKLLQPMQCCGISGTGPYDYGGAAPYRRCEAKAKEPDGFCGRHKKTGIEKSIWAIDWRRMRGIQGGDSWQGDMEKEYGDIADSIQCTASRRQILFLLQLGAKANRLQGINSEKASKMITRLKGKQ